MKITLSKSQWEEMGKVAGWNPYGKGGDLESGFDDIMKKEPVSDPGEAALRENDNVSRRRHIKVNYSDGDFAYTEVNGTVADIRKYYLHPSNNVPQDYDMAHPEKTRTVTSVEFIK